MSGIISSSGTPLLQYWVAARPLPGEYESGDQYLVAPFPHGVLVAVVDGLGHGCHAAAAAKAAIAVLGEHAGTPLVPLVRRCHEALRKTRGAVMSLAMLSEQDNTMTWLGIGNVEGIFVSPRGPDKVSLLLRGGIVGDRLPTLLPTTVPLYPGSLLFLATDGIHSAFVQDIHYAEHPCDLIHQIFSRHVKNTDDALLLGARWIKDQAVQDILHRTSPASNTETNH